MTKDYMNSDTCFCGKKWGTHTPEFEVLMKPNCVVCGDPIKAQCEELYYQKGNYCAKCNNKCNMNKDLYKEKFINPFLTSKLC